MQLKNTVHRFDGGGRWQLQAPLAVEHATRIDLKQPTSQRPVFAQSRRAVRQITENVSQ